jgi:hypothetical protein
MKNTAIILLTFCFTFFSCQHTMPKTFKTSKKMKLFNREIIIPDINKNVEKLSSTEKEAFETRNQIAFDKTITKRREMVKRNSREILPDTLYVNLKEFNSQTNEAVYYGFNNQTKEFGTITYYDSDPLLEDETIREQYFEAQPMKFDLYKGYYPNGNIKMKRLMFSNILIKQYEYDENGTLTKSYDLSKNYKLSVTDILKILEKNNIGINFKLNGNIGRSTSPFTYLYCWETNKGKIWHLEQYEDEKEYIIFDETEELISQKRYSKEKGSFAVLSIATFKMHYNNKTLEEAEKETGLKLFVVGYEN